MKKIISLAVLAVVSLNVQALIPLGFDAFTQTDLPQKSGLPVSLVAKSANGNCNFYGETREQPKAGFFNELLNRKDYFVDITRFTCGDTVVTVKPITALYNAPLKAGEKIRLPYIDLVVSQTISSIESFYNDIEIKCDSGSVWYTWKSANIPIQTPLWVDGKTIGCSDNSYTLGGKSLTNDEVKRFVFKDMETQSAAARTRKSSSGGGIPTFDAGAVSESIKSQENK